MAITKIAGELLESNLIRIQDLSFSGQGGGLQNLLHVDVTNGRIGVKTDSPGNFALDVNGSTRIQGDLTVTGTTTTIDSQNLSVEDNMIVLNSSGSVGNDSGVMINRGAANNAAIYWNEGDDTFKAVTTTSDGTGTTIADTALAKIQAAEPAAASDVATKNYVDTSASSFTLKVAGDDSTAITVNSGQLLQFTGSSNIQTAGSEPDTINIALTSNLTDIHSITNSSTNADLTLNANSNGSVVINDVLTFNANRSGEPGATAVTKMFAQTPSGGGTGVFFVNSAVSSGAAGELISKKKATALAIALG